VVGEPAAGVGGGGVGALGAEEEDEVAGRGAFEGGGDGVIEAIVQEGGEAGVEEGFEEGGEFVVVDAVAVADGAFGAGDDEGGEGEAA